MSQEKKPEYDSTSYIQDYAIGLEIHEPKYYERIPDILDFLTYIDESMDTTTGEKVYQRKRLTPIEKELYRIIKRAAGESICFKSRNTLAEEVNCSAGAITEAKKTLCQSFEQLDGNSLITIENRLVPTRDGEKVVNRKIQHFITVNHIWNHNNAFMSSFRKHESFRTHYKELWGVGILSKEEAEIFIERMIQSPIVHKSGAMSPDDLAKEARSPADLAPQRAMSPADPNHTNHNHTPYVNTYPRSEERNIDSSKKKDVYEMMNKFGIYEAVQKRLIEKHGWQRLVERAITFRNKNLSKVSNLGAYFISVLES